MQGLNLLLSVLRTCVYKGGKQDVTQAVNGKFVKIIVGKIESEAAFEVFDSACELISVKCGERRGSPLEIFS